MKNLKELSVSEQKNINGGDSFMYWVGYYWSAVVQWGKDVDRALDGGTHCSQC